MCWGRSWQRLGCWIGWQLLHIDVGRRWISYVFLTKVIILPLLSLLLRSLFLYLFIYFLFIHFLGD